MKPSADTIKQFLLWVGKGPWHLCAIQNGNSKPQGIWTENLDVAVDFALQWNEQKWNVYWTVNPLMRDPGPKPKESDILEMQFIHVDVDPRLREDLDDEQLRIKQLLAAAEPKPSAVIFSGGGYQAFWRLEKALPINGREELYNAAKLYNRQMEINYEADACHNTDRLMRLPGTINWPNKRKIEKGRKPTLATVVDLNDGVHPIEMFTKAVPVQSKTGMGATKKMVKVSGNVKRLDSLESLRGKVHDSCIRTIAHGHDPEDPMKHDGDRSKAVWYTVCELVRGEVDDETIFSIITDKEWGISAHVLDQSRPEDYALRQIERAREQAIAPELAELNDQYAIVLVSGKYRVLREDRRPGEEYPTLDFLTKSDFADFLGHRFMQFSLPDGKTKDVSLPKWWLMHANARRYDGVLFHPGDAPHHYYNLWRGFAYPAKPGDCSAFLDHIRDNICCGREDWYDYMVGWMAHAVQKPGEPGHTAIVFQGKEGVGKGFYANTFGRLFGRHYLPVRDSEHVFGRFNGHLQDCVVLFADESFWVGGRKQASMLKALITEPEVVVERKGLDATRSRNCVHLIMASNEAHVVARSDHDRRFFVLQVGEEQMQNATYFGRIADQMEHGGYEALLYYLLNYDITEFDIRSIPQTEAASAQSDHTRSGIEAWWHEKLWLGQVYDDDSQDNWPTYVFRDELLLDLRTYLKSYGDARQPVPNRIQLGRFMGPLLPIQTGDRIYGDFAVRVRDNEEPVQKSNPRIYQLGTLEQCRKLWEEIKCHGRAQPWPVSKVIRMETQGDDKEAF